jgi:hypothetical protein
MKFSASFLILAEEEWIEEQLALNPDFDPNEETTGKSNNGDEQQQHTLGNGLSVNQTTAQNGSSDKVEQTGEGTNADGENMAELPPKPKRFVSSNNFYIILMRFVSVSFFSSVMNLLNISVQFFIYAVILIHRI